MLVTTPYMTAFSGWQAGQRQGVSVSDVMVGGWAGWRAQHREGLWAQRREEGGAGWVGRLCIEVPRVSSK